MKREMTLAEWVRWTVVQTFEASRQRVLDLDDDIIPTLNASMGTEHGKGVNRAYLLNTIMFKGSGFTVHSNGTGVQVSLTHKVVSRSGKKKR